jgi:prepilin-type N-terminal cleavage/methylation domain-containing protein
MTYNSRNEANMMRDRRSGFTLIEVLVVLLISAIVFAVLISVMGSSFEILRAGESKARLQANARTLMDYIVNDIESASYIPLSSDRDLNGWPDESDDAQGLGYDELAHWRVAEVQNNVPVVAASYFLSEAWADRIQLRHFNNAFGGFITSTTEARATPRVISQAGGDRAAQWISFFRLAVPANQQMPYGLAMESDRNNDGVVDPINTGLAGIIEGYPEQVAIGPHKETAVAIQDLWYAIDNDPEFRRIRQIPISSNITRMRFEYFHEVPVYQSRLSGNTLEILHQDISNGDVAWIGENLDRTDNMIPLIDHWEHRLIDVAYNGSNTGGGFWSDPATGLTYGTIGYKIQDQYPEGYDDGKRTGVHVNPPTGFGLGVLGAGGTGWNCTVFYEIDQDGDQDGDNAPIDRYAYVTTGRGGAGPVEGGIAQIRPDMGVLHGEPYYTYTTDPTGFGDLGDADGIPDGDGQPDDPVPGWWLPYLRSIRVTIVATPSSIIEQRIARSGQDGKLGNPVFYRLDSPVPFADAGRTRPLYNQKQDYIGPGADLVLTKTVPVNFAYRENLVTDPKASILSATGLRRVELNYFNSEVKMFQDPVPYDTQIVPLTPADKLFERDPTARQQVFQ